MKRSTYHGLPLLLLLWGPFAAHAQTKKTIASGNWNNPAVWSPSGVPSSTSPADSLIVSHSLSFTGTLDARNTASQAFVVKPGGAINGAGTYDTLVLGITQSIIIQGNLSARTLAFGDVTLSAINTGNIYATSSMACSDEFHNYHFVDAGHLMSSGDFYNEAGAVIVCDSLTSSDNLTNDGDISTGYWINDAVATGNAGQFCITGCFMNVNDISGTVDICDASTSFCDIDAGTIASTVTFCAAGPCNMTTAITSENKAVPAFSLYPNPSDGHVILEGDFGASTLYVINATGETVATLSQVLPQTRIDLGQLTQGVYMMMLVNEQFRHTQKVIIVNQN